jgi:tRNA nucleotidyltransferase (CCA-adding enzyme)
MNQAMSDVEKRADLDLALCKPQILQIAHLAAQMGGQAFLVGGCVRDILLGIPPKDIDIEIFHISHDDLETALKKEFKVNFIGKSFGVFKLKEYPIDISTPRLETVIGYTHQSFCISTDPHLSLKKAAERRDFTINAMFLDPLSGLIHDPFGGQADLENKILRHVSTKFTEDALRVLRGMQFIARFELTADPATTELCKTLAPYYLAQERVFEEWQKLLLQGIKPSLGLEFLRQTGWIRHYPELQALINCPQDPTWHPEGDVWVHTLHALDAFARKRINNPEEDLIVGLAVLCHDFGKPITTHRDEQGRIRSPGHDVASQAPTRNFLNQITRNKLLIESVVILVALHMRPSELYRGKANDSAIRRLATAVGHMDRLMRVVEADDEGRPPHPPNKEIIDWLLKRCEALFIQDKSPSPILLGRHLIALGLSPQPSFSNILKLAFDAQLDGHFSDETSGLIYLKEAILPKFEKTLPLKAVPMEPVAEQSILG